MSAWLSIDTAVYRWVTGWPSSPLLVGAMQALSAVGTWGTVFVLLAVVIAVRNRGLAAMGAWRVVLAIVLALIVSDSILKPLVDRPRPYQVLANARVLWPHPHSGSFPSGHAAAAAAGAYTLALLWPGGRVLAWVLAVLIALSRVYLGVHYPLDVAAGAVVGLLCARFATANTVAQFRGGRAT